MKKAWKRPEIQSSSVEPQTPKLLMCSATELDCTGTCNTCFPGNIFADCDSACNPGP